jgi:hypothetical protein
MLLYIFTFHISFTERKYSTLCELCELKGKCSHNLHAKGNQHAALDCLTQRGGDVAYVEHHAVKKYFSVSHLLFYYFINMTSLETYFKVMRGTEKMIEITT